MIRFTKAKPKDAKELAWASWRAFNNDANYGAPGKGGPIGYKSERWQSRMIRIGMYYKILDDLRIIGGFVVFDRGGGHYELERIFLDSDYQNQGIGTQAIEFMEKQFPNAKTWTLSTPRWNRRTQHFYEKMGYVKTGVDGLDGIRYGKIIRKPTIEEE